MIVQLEVLGVSTELVRHVVFALAKHNEAWWRRERAAGRTHVDWMKQLRYKRPAVASTIVLRDASTILPTMSGGCGELAAMFAGWMWSLDRRAEIDDARVQIGTWHARVLYPGAHEVMSIWDPERNLSHVA